MAYTKSTMVPQIKTFLDFNEKFLDKRVNEYLEQMTSIKGLTDILDDEELEKIRKKNAEDASRYIVREPRKFMWNFVNFKISNSEKDIVMTVIVEANFDINQLDEIRERLGMK